MMINVNKHLARVVLYVTAVWLGTMSVALAQSPENGWWWTQGESGRGYNIEVQNDLVFVATFIYENDGTPIWYSGGGKMTGNRWIGELFRFRDGQCLTCDYVPPIQDGSLPFTIEFTDTDQASVTFSGVRFDITRFPFGFDGSVRDLLGEWLLMAGSSIYIGDRITLNRTQVLNGSLTAVGFRTGNTNRLALGLSTDSGQLGFGISGVTIDEIMVIEFDGYNRVTGRYWNYPKGEAPTGSGLEFVAARLHQLTGISDRAAARSAPIAEDDWRRRVTPQPVLTERDTQWEQTARDLADQMHGLLN